MKIINDYDLMDKINKANGDINLRKIMLEELRAQAIMYGAMTSTQVVLGGIQEVQWAFNLIICSSFFAVNVALITMLKKSLKDDVEFKAYLELAKLTLQLANLNINTSPDLLKEATVSETDSKIYIDADHKPVINQKKYILVPTYDGLGNTNETSFLQEHNLGSKKYVLSIGSPQKKLQLRPAFNA